MHAEHRTRRPRRLRLWLDVAGAGPRTWRSFRSCTGGSKRTCVANSSCARAAPFRSRCARRDRRRPWRRRWRWGHDPHSTLFHGLWLGCQRHTRHQQHPQPRPHFRAVLRVAHVALLRCTTSTCPPMCTPCRPPTARHSARRPKSAALRHCVVVVMLARAAQLRAAGVL